MPPRSQNALIAQSGGPTAVINQSLVGCVEALAGGSIGRILGARHGVEGVLAEDFVDLGELDRDFLERLANTPSAALGSTRQKPGEDVAERILEVLDRRDVTHFFYIGGNDSADTCRIVRSTARSRGRDLRCFHVPKTIDNDLARNDHTPGFPSAARFVALASIGDNLDNAALPGVKINVVMGRNAGFLTAASAIARRHEGDGPHLIYLPERVFDPEDFVDDVDRVYRRLGRCVVAVSEGVRDRAGNAVTVMMSQWRETDAHGNLQYSGTGALGDFLAERLRQDLGKRHAKVRVRADTLGYVQRSFHDASPVDRIEARAVGERAGLLALEGAEGGSITIQRASTDPYRAEFGLVPLEDVAARTRTMPAEFFEAERADVTEAYVRWLRPLVGDLPEVARLEPARRS